MGALCVWVHVHAVHNHCRGISYHGKNYINPVAHRCNCKGCGTVLVVDGNMKNNREVCSAADAGYIEYAGLPGSVKTGCTETPERKSKFCSLHKPRSLLTAEKKSSGRVIESILASKQTRTNMFYQVYQI